MTSTNQDYRPTLNLPATDFPMKGNLPQREPQILAKWQENDIYKNIRTARSGREKWVLHDGPPYANGRLHLGHAVNKILKDVIVKCFSLCGYDSPYVPGWDCHGLPIEVNVEKKLGRPKDAEQAQKFRQECRDYAKNWLDIQRTEFKRMGVIGDWDNPYITMDYKVEADIIRSLGVIYNNGHIEQGYKPVQWCLHCQSALAEAEVEYKDKTSAGISVGFPLPPEDEAEFFKRVSEQDTGGKKGQGQGQKQGQGQGQGQGKVMFVIWTTTPWTIAANRAVTLNPDLEYCLVQSEREEGNEPLRLLLAKELVDDLLKKYSMPNKGILATITGNKLQGLVLRHPYYERDSLVTVGDYVNVESGSGLVHSAPAYGLDDFFMGKKHGLELDNPVNDYGKYASETPLVGGMHIFKDEDKLISLIKESGCLIHSEDYQHQYPHCWRHKTPTIYRATTQWFISMTKQDLIGKVLKETPDIRWTPEWGQGRIEGMMTNRPDWCISRQRHWGVPIPFFVHKESKEPHPRTAELIEDIAKLIEKEGVDAWHHLEARDLLGDEADEYSKVQHILDVWFDSGSTHFSVLRQRPELDYPAAMYLEGSDQHRGWFQSSILCGVAMDEKAPYREVLTHGFTVDSQGHKMSKSLGNIIEPSEVINRLGADVLRWWVISSDYTNEMVISQDILASTSDIYRKVRNTLRFLLANLHDFDASQHLLTPSKMLSLDQWVVDRTLQLQEELRDDYTNYRYPAACRKIHHFCVRELGGFYLDIIKDRQYTMHKESEARRSAQSAIFHTLEALVRWLAPITSFTAEEVWGYMPGMPGMPGKRDASVLTAEWYDGLFDLASVSSALGHEEWATIFNVKEQVNRLMEEQRSADVIGSSLEAEVTLYCDDELRLTIDKLGDELKFFFITSAAQLKPKADAPSDALETSLPGLLLSSRPSAAVKCARCWHRSEDVGKDASHPDICSRCVTNLSAPGETRLHG